MSAPKTMFIHPESTTHGGDATIAHFNRPLLMGNMKEYRLVDTNEQSALERVRAEILDAYNLLEKYMNSTQLISHHIGMKCEQNGYKEAMSIIDAELAKGKV